MFAIEVHTEFFASHQLRLPGGGIEPLHDHNWRVTARIQSAQLDALETVMDFHTLEESLKKICVRWHSRNFNDIRPFDKAINPSAERIAQHIADLLAPKIPPPAALQYISITEAPGCVAMYFPE